MNLNDPPAALLAAGPPAGALSQTRQFVTFHLGDELFAVDMAPVQEIIRVPAVSRMPLAPPALVGLANLRGRVLPIVDLRRLFQLPAQADDDANRALVIDLGQPLGFIVDRVASVIGVEPAEIAPADAIQSVVHADYLAGVIQRRAADGTTRLLPVLDFAHLVRTQFDAVAGRPAGAGLERLQDGGPAAAAAAVAADDEALRLVSFTVAGQEYALAIADVQEIVQVPEAIPALPRTPPHVLGVISLRRRLLPLVSLRRLFGLADDRLDEHHRIVVVALPGGAQVGLVTDSVKEVLAVPRTLVDAVPPALAASADLRSIQAICRLEDGRRLVSLIAADALLGLQTIRDAIATASTAGAGAGATASGSQSMNPNDSADHVGQPLDDVCQMVVFRLGAEEFGVPIMSVQEIVRVPDTLTRLPRTPAWVEGVINLRGTVLPVIDQRRRFGLPAGERHDRQRIMVYAFQGLRTGFIVDSVAEVLRIPRAQIEAAPALTAEQGRLITQVAKLDGDRRLVLLIDPDQLLDAGEAGAVAQALAAPDVVTA